MSALEYPAPLRWHPPEKSRHPCTGVAEASAPRPPLCFCICFGRPWSVIQSALHLHLGLNMSNWTIGCDHLGNPLSLADRLARARDCWARFCILLSRNNVGHPSDMVCLRHLYQYLGCSIPSDVQEAMMLPKQTAPEQPQQAAAAASAAPEQTAPELLLCSSLRSTGGSKAISAKDCSDS